MYNNKKKVHKFVWPIVRNIKQDYMKTSVEHKKKKQIKKIPTNKASNYVSNGFIMRFVQSFDQVSDNIVSFKHLFIPQMHSGINVIHWCTNERFRFACFNIIWKMKSQMICRAFREPRHGLQFFFFFGLNAELPSTHKVCEHYTHNKLWVFTDQHARSSLVKRSTQWSDFEI